MVSPTRLSYVTLDVFTQTSYAGNPLAIVKVPSNQSLTQEQKQLIAREFNFSETVILHENEAASYEHTIDIFMTNAEIPFAGHPTIGAAAFSQNCNYRRMTAHRVEPSLPKLGRFLINMMLS
jgi:PhzF family phenazine biosynthesis protein